MTQGPGNPEASPQTGGSLEATVPHIEVLRPQERWA
jgi:hypothetical protein